MPHILIEKTDQFLAYLQYEKRFSTHTIRAYGDDLTYFFQFMADQYDLDSLDQLTAAMVRSWMAALTLQEVQPRSVNRKLSSVRSFVKYCLLKGELAKNPLKGLPPLKTRKRLPSFIEEEHMQQLLHQVAFPDTLEGRLELLVVSMLYQTGMRVSELANLALAHIDLNRLQVKVLGKGNKERIIPIDQGLAAKIKSFLLERNEAYPDLGVPELLINAKGKKVSTRKIYDIVKKYLSLVTTAEKKSPHVLRHSFATHLTGHGAELNAVKELLGHSSLAATQVYTHNSIERLRDIHKKAHPKG